MSSKFNEDQFNTAPQPDTTQGTEFQTDKETAKASKKAEKEERKKQQHQQPTGNNNVSTIPVNPNQELRTLNKKGNLVPAKLVNAADGSGTILVPLEEQPEDEEIESLKAEVKAYNKARYDRGLTKPIVADENTSLVANTEHKEEPEKLEGDLFDKVQGGRNAEEEIKKLQQARQQQNQQGQKKGTLKESKEGLFVSE